MFGYVLGWSERPNIGSRFPLEVGRFDSSGLQVIFRDNKGQEFEQFDSIHADPLILFHVQIVSRNVLKKRQYSLDYVRRHYGGNGSFGFERRWLALGPLCCILPVGLCGLCRRSQSVDRRRAVGPEFGKR